MTNFLLNYFEWYFTIILFDYFRWFIFTLDLMKNEMMSFIEHFSFRSDKWKMKLSVCLFVHLSVCLFVRLLVSFNHFFFNCHLLAIIGNHLYYVDIGPKLKLFGLEWWVSYESLNIFESFLIQLSPLKEITDNVINW